MHDPAFSSSRLPPQSRGPRLFLRVATKTSRTRQTNRRRISHPPRSLAQRPAKPPHPRGSPAKTHPAAGGLWPIQMSDREAPKWQSPRHPTSAAPLSNVALPDPTAPQTHHPKAFHLKQKRPDHPQKASPSPRVRPSATRQTARVPLRSQSLASDRDAAGSRF